MPPKSAAPKDCDEALKRLLDNQENPKEADFKAILDGAKGDDKQKEIAANYIPYFYEKFPKQQKAALNAMIDLSKSNVAKARSAAIRKLSNFFALDKALVGEALINALGDDDEKNAEVAKDTIVRLLSQDEEFKPIFFSNLSSANAGAQFHMVEIIRDNINFTEENVDQLLEVLKVAFKSCVVGGLSLYRKNRKLINEEQFQPLVDDLFIRLDNSLQKESDFKDVSEELLVPLFKFTKTLGDASTTRLLSIIANRVIPHFDLLEPSKQLEVIRKIANVAKYADSDKLLTEIYNNIFLSFPTENSGQINFSIIEATLWAFMTLARKFNSAASKLIGTTLCYTGQPGEADEADEDETKHADFRKRVEYISSIAPEFVDQYEGKIKRYQNEAANTEEERKEKRDHIIEAKEGRRTGLNVIHLTRLLLSSNPLSGNLPKSPSWKKPTNDKRFGSNRRDQRNRRGGRSSSYNRNDRGNNRSRNGRYNNNNNRQRGRRSNSDRR